MRICEGVVCVLVTSAVRESPTSAAWGNHMNNDVTGASTGNTLSIAFMQYNVTGAATRSLPSNNHLGAVRGSPSSDDVTDTTVC